MCETSATAAGVPIVNSTSRHASSSWSRASSSSARSSSAATDGRRVPPAAAPSAQLRRVHVDLEPALRGEDQVQVRLGPREVCGAGRLGALVRVHVVGAAHRDGGAGLALDEVLDLALEVLAVDAVGAAGGQAEDGGGRQQ